MIRRKLAARREQRQASLRSTDSDEWVLDDIEEQINEPEPTLSNSIDADNSADNVWNSSEKHIYEQQLEHLQEQLEGALIDNQELKIRIKELETTPGSNSGAKDKKNTFTRDKKRGRHLSTETTGERSERISSPANVTNRSNKRYWELIKDHVFNVLYDFTDESQNDFDEDDTEPPLQTKKLQENLQRLVLSSKPYRSMGTLLLDITQWTNPSLTLVTFLVYMYCVWSGWIIQLVLLIAIVYLSINYLRVIRVAEQFGFTSQEDEATKDQYFKSLGLLDKFQLIREVGRTVQNASEKLSDNLEKGQNLLLWRQPQATRKLYSNLCLIFIISLFLPTSYTLTLAGLGIGFKIFIIDNIYRKYPKVKAKYDGVARLWRSLPTNNDLLLRQSLTEDEIRDDNTDVSMLRTSFSLSDTAFCERFQLSLQELPLENWTSGKKCTLLDREKPLIGSKSGRLFLTHSHLCFERSQRPSDNTDRFKIALCDIESICKAKPFAVLPGSGMSIEVFKKNSDKPTLFGAILHRDQAYQSICDQATVIGLAWGTDPENLQPEPGLSLEPSTDGTPTT